MITLLLRGGLIAFAASAVAVAATVLPIARDLDKERNILTFLSSGGAARPDVLQPALDRMRQRGDGTVCRPEAGAAGVAISAGIAEHYLASANHGAVDAAITAAVAIARDTLRCEPLEASAWIALARFEFLTSGDAARALELLRFTYTVAPREGWVRSLRAAFLMELRTFLTSEDEERLLTDLTSLVEGEASQTVALLVRKTDTAFQKRLGQRVAALSFVRQRQYQIEAIRNLVDVSALSVPASSHDYFRFDRRDRLPRRD